MPRIFDNIDQDLLPELRSALAVSHRADFCVGYFNLRGWRPIADTIEPWPGGDGGCVRLLVGMHYRPDEELRRVLRVHGDDDLISNAVALKMRRSMAEVFRDQIAYGAPSNQDYETLRRLVGQLRARKVVVKLHARYPLHAKLYLTFRHDRFSPIIGFLGSSNLTFAGLSRQGELNIDVVEHDPTEKLAQWFQERWDDRFSIDISDDLAQVIEESWAREVMPPPYQIYVKMAYHLAREAREGMAEYTVPSDVGSRLLDFQQAAVTIAAHHLNKRGGVLIGDVVGLGKTLMATALARIFEDDYGLSTLILCPKNLVPMWEKYRDEYRLHARVLSYSRVLRELKDLRRFRLVLLDESHNLRNREGRVYNAIREYIRQNESKVVLLSATPYNKSYQDLANQLRLFVPDDRDIGIRPEALLREIGESQFMHLHNCSPKSLAAFEKSSHVDDWRELMRLYMVRRTRTFIKNNYASIDPDNGRVYLQFPTGGRAYFAERTPRTVRVRSGRQYAGLYSDEVVDAIGRLSLPRYGLGLYAAADAAAMASPDEQRALAGLSRAGRRLMGFCRTNLFKRLESSGHSFLLSVQRHLVRNHVFLHALRNGLPLPIGSQDANLLDTRSDDTDSVIIDVEDVGMQSDELEEIETGLADTVTVPTEADMRKHAAQIYNHYHIHYLHRFGWLRAELFNKHALVAALQDDSAALLEIIRSVGLWDATADTKLARLKKLIELDHANSKVLVFTQFADTAQYLGQHLAAPYVAVVTGASSNPTELAWRFSPASNGYAGKIESTRELRVLVATDILSEGQNLQDCSVVVNYDIPWAIIRLVQRAGRVDRIGQQAEGIDCYTFWPDDGVENLIRLRERVRARLRENQEVVGSDEAFFEDDLPVSVAHDLYNEKSGVLDDDDEDDVDLASYAYRIWRDAVKRQPELEKIIPDLPPVVPSSRAHTPTVGAPEGVLVYLRTAEGNDALAWIDGEGRSFTESQYAILRAAECDPDTPAALRHEQHYSLVEKGIRHIVETERSVGGELGRPSGVRFRLYERMREYLDDIAGTLFDTLELRRAHEAIARAPLLEGARDAIRRQLQSGVGNREIADLAVVLYEQGRLTYPAEEAVDGEPQIICSLGLFKPT